MRAYTQNILFAPPYVCASCNKVANIQIYYHRPASQTAYLLRNTKTLAYYLKFYIAQERRLHKSMNLLFQHTLSPLIICYKFTDVKDHVCANETHSPQRFNHRRWHFGATGPKAHYILATVMYKLLDLRARISFFVLSSSHQRVERPTLRNTAICILEHSVILRLSN